jgi:transcription elongation factor GreB
MTPRGHARLKAELLQLLDQERPEVVRTVAWAASNGDRSENGDYIYGKKRLREIDRRIRYLTKQLEAAEVVDPTLQGNTDQVFFGASVVYIDSSGSRKTITITGRDEADPRLGEVSWLSPIARAFLRRRAGDIVTLATPAGEAELEIVEVRYEAVTEPTRCVEAPGSNETGLRDAFDFSASGRP